MKFNLIIALCIVLIAVNADKKTDFDKCATTCADTRKTEIAKLTGTDLSKAKDEFATLEKCAYNKDSTDGTVKTGITQSSTCSLFEMDKDFSDANIGKWAINRNKCIKGCEKKSGSTDHFESKPNMDWLQCDQLCRAETFTEEKVKTLYKCFATCDVKYSESIAKSAVSNKQLAAEEAAFLLTWAFCSIGKTACQEYNQLNDNWEDATYLDKRYACESPCYKQGQPTQFSKNKVACQAQCTKAFGSTVQWADQAPGGNADFGAGSGSSQSQVSQFVLGAFIALASLAL